MQRLSNLGGVFLVLILCTSLGCDSIHRIKNSSGTVTDDGAGFELPDGDEALARIYGRAHWAEVESIPGEQHNAIGVFVNYSKFVVGSCFKSDGFDVSQKGFAEFDEIRTGSGFQHEDDYCVDGVTLAEHACGPDVIATMHYEEGGTAVIAHRDDAKGEFHVNCQQELGTNGACVDGACRIVEPPDPPQPGGPLLESWGQSAKLKADAGLPGAAYDPLNDVVHIFGGLAGRDSDLIQRFALRAPMAPVMPHGRLPNDLYAQGTIYLDGSIFLVGGVGDSGFSDEILRYDIATGNISVFARFPTDVYGAGVVLGEDASGNPMIYAVGGWSSRVGEHLSTIYRIDPRATQDQVELIGDLGFTVWFGSAVWNPGDRSIVLFGGQINRERSDLIHRIDPLAATTTPLPVRLPSARSSVVATWHEANGVAYVAGGRFDIGESDEMLLFDPLQSSGVLPLVTNLPDTLENGTMVYDPVSADMIIIGGYVGPGNTDRILRFRPSQSAVMVLGELLMGIKEQAIATTNGIDYLFGGESDGRSVRAEVIRVNPTQLPENQIVGIAPLPVAVRAAAAASAPDAAYIFGGYNGAGELMDGVMRFDFASERAEIMSGDPLPMPLAAMAAVWADRQHDQDVAYLIGGENEASEVSDIHEFNPSAGVGAKFRRVGNLPLSLKGVAAVWDQANDRVLIFGGDGDAGSSNRIYEFLPASGVINQLPGTLPSPVHSAFALMNEAFGVSYLLGGRQRNNRTLNHVVMYDPSQPEPVLRLPIDLPKAVGSHTASLDPMHNMVRIYGGAERLGTRETLQSSIMVSSF